MKDLVLGIDIGTTSVKTILISASGGIEWEMSKAHDLVSSEPGFAEEDPDEWWDSVTGILREISREGFGDRIACIGVTGMVPTLILVDKDLNPIRFSIQQNDARSTDEIEEYKNAVEEEEYFSVTANTINQQVIFPKYEWLRKHEPQNVSKTKWLMGSYDFIATRLTGNPHVELNWALESGLWCVSERKWFSKILEISHIDSNMLPKVMKPTEIVGKTTKELAENTGLPEGIPVVAGSADHIASSLAVGLKEEGDLLLKFGGAGDIMFVTDSLKVDKRMFLDYHDIPGKFVMNGCMASSGSLVKWYMQLIHENDFNEMRKKAEKSGVGSQGLIVLPYFLGEKTPIFDTKARGVIFGLDLHHGEGDIYRAVMESVVYGFMHHIEVLNDHDFKIKRVFVSDGGAKDPLWRQITADATGADVRYITDNPGSSLGAAFIAGISVGFFKEWDEIDKFLTKSVPVKANMKNHELYQKYFRLYRKLYETVKPLFNELYQLKEEE